MLICRTDVFLNTKVYDCVCVFRLRSKKHAIGTNVLQTLVQNMSMYAVSSNRGFVMYANQC